MMVTTRSTSICIAICIAAMLSTVVQAASTNVRAVDILNEIEIHGANATVHDLYAAGDQWDEVMSHIAQGRRDWLQVATALRPGTDGGAAESLNEAIFLALEPSPRRVLMLLQGGHFKTTLICSSNIMIDYPAARARALIRKRIRVLSRLAGVSSAHVQKQCIAGLKAALMNIASPE